MTRRSNASGKAAKTRLRKAARPKPSPKAEHRSPSDASQGTVAQLARELKEAREQQSATSEVLRIISSSPGDMKPVFEAMLANALRICKAKFGHILLYDGERYHAAHLHDVPPRYRQFWQQHGPIRPGSNTGLARLARTKQVAHIPDLKADSAYAEGEPLRVVTVDHAGARTLLAVPMVKQEQLVGAIIIYRQEVRPFTDRQIELVQNFAAQAVIAIENTRLLNELRQRTDDLTELLEQQTATSEVLRVISGSPGQLAPVFEILLQKAVKICDGKFGTLVLSEGDYNFRIVATHNAPPAFADLRLRKPVIRRGPGTAMGRVFETKQIVHIRDIAADISAAPTHAQIAGARTLVIVPMLKNEELVGGIAIYRQEVRSFNQKQIDLLLNFASQAVIAIENFRLLNELRQRTTDLTESLEQQTATAEVLKVISSSASDLRPVFDAVLASATRLCEASYGTMWLHENNGQMRAVARHGTLPDAFRDKWQIGTLFRPSPSVPTARAFASRKPVQVINLKDDRSYFDRDPLAVASVDIAGIRSLIAVPMLKEETVVGTLNIYRREVRPFTNKQIELLQNFAAQAVIAIENARLLNELRESLERQTATADVLRVISSSPGELEPVFQVMLENATHICEAKFRHLLRFDGKMLHLAAQVGDPPELAEF